MHSPTRKDHSRCVTRRQLTGYAMSLRQQAPRPIQCRSCTGSVPLRGVLRPRRLRERNRHAGDFWRPSACLMAGWGQGEPGSSRIRRVKGVLAIVLARDRSLGANVRALQAAQPRARNSAADAPASRHTFGQRIHTSIPNSSLAPRRRTRLQPINIHGRPLAEGRMGRKGAWGGSEPGAEASLERKRAWGGREAATVPVGRKGAWGGREAGAHGKMGRTVPEQGGKGSIGRKRVWGGREYGVLGTSRHTDLHFDPQATTFLSPPGGIYLIFQGGPNLVKFRV